MQISVSSPVDEYVSNFIKTIKNTQQTLIKNTDEELESFINKFHSITFLDLVGIFCHPDEKEYEKQSQDFINELKDGVIDNDFVETIVCVLVMVLDGMHHQ